VKYLGKLHKLDWTERHVSYSRRFFPPAALPSPQPSTLKQTQRLPLHPYVFLLQHFRDQYVIELALHRWDISRDETKGQQPIDFPTLGIHSPSLLENPPLQTELPFQNPLT
jgi:hypothetical protein